MMKTVKHTIHSIGDTGGDFAKTIGSGTVDLAHRGGDFAKAIGSGTADLAQRFGIGSSSLAKRIGTRRGLLGIVVVAAAVGGSIMLVRYLRARKAAAETDITSDDLASGITSSTRHGKYAHPSSSIPGTH